MGPVFRYPFLPGDSSCLYSNKGVQMEKRMSIKTVFYKALLSRLVAATLLIAGFSVFASFYHSQQMVNDAIIQFSKVQINFIKSRLHEVISKQKGDLKAALQLAVAFPPATALQLREGEFIYIMLHDERRESVAIFQHDVVRTNAILKKHIAAVIEIQSSHAYQGPEYNWIEIGGKTFLEIHESVLEEGKDTTIYLRALFTVSDQALESIRNFTLQSTLAVLAAVVVTVVLLYPVITILFNRITLFSSDLLTAHLQTMEALGETIAKRDRDTSYHNYRVTIFAVSLALKVKIAQDKMKGLIKGAFLHDIGKIGVKDEVLFSQKQYGKKEHAIMQDHVLYGLEIIRRSKWLKDGAPIVGNHHEKYDGSGYPAGLRGDDIPLEARIFAIADVFDALSSKRPYKEPYSYEKTMALMQEARGTHFDPVVFDIFKRIAPELFAEYANSDDDKVKTKFKDITDLYFHCDINVLKRKNLFEAE